MYKIIDWTKRETHFRLKPQGLKRIDVCIKAGNQINQKNIQARSNPKTGSFPRWVLIYFKE